MSSAPPPPPLPAITQQKAVLNTGKITTSLEDILAKRREKPVEKKPVFIDLKQEFCPLKHQNKTMRMVVISDSHNMHSRLDVPPGDVLLHCGDMSDDGLDSEIESFNTWLGTLPHKHKIVICGNHEEKLGSLTADQIRLKFTNAHYLHDESLQLDNGAIKIYGTPYVPNLGKWEAHMCPFDNQAFYRSFDDLIQVWSKIPDDTQILLTHTPPHDILDGVLKYGCPNLKKKLLDLKQLQVHCFGHVHAAYGHKKQGNVTFINAAVDRDEQPFYFDFHY